MKTLIIFLLFLCLCPVVSFAQTDSTRIDTTFKKNIFGRMKRVITETNINKQIVVSEDKSTRIEKIEAVGSPPIKMTKSDTPKKTKTVANQTRHGTRVGGFKLRIGYKSPKMVKSGRKRHQRVPCHSFAGNKYMTDKYSRKKPKYKY